MYQIVVGYLLFSHRFIIFFPPFTVCHMDSCGILYTLRFLFFPLEHNYFMCQIVIGCLSLSHKSITFFFIIHNLPHGPL